MTQKVQLGLGAAGLAVLIAAAAFAYNKLGNVVNPDTALAYIEEQGEVSETVRYKAPDFTMSDQDGNSVTLAHFIANGKPIVINFWASWCPPCTVEMPDFDKVYQETGGEIQFLMLNLVDGQRETIEKGKQYIQDQGFSFPVYFDTRQEGAYMYGIRAIPTTLFIDAQGYIISGAQGAIQEQTLRKGIESIWTPLF